MNRKTILKIAGVAVMAFFASCGSGSVDPTEPESLKDYAIEKAEEAVAETESPVMGTLPSIFVRRSAALDTISKIRKEELGKIMPQDEDEVGDALKKVAAIKAAEEKAEEAVKAYFDGRIKEKAAGFVGKEFPCKFDKSQYADAKGTITKIEDNRVFANVKLTLSAPLAGGAYTSVRYVVYEFVDADGKTVQQGAADFDISKGGLDAGDVVDVEVSSYLRSFEKIAAVYFRERK